MVLEVQAINYLNEAQQITYQIRNTVRLPEGAPCLQELNLRLQLILDKLLPEAFGSVLHSHGTEKSKQWVYANTEKMRVEDPQLFDKIWQIFSAKFCVIKAVFDLKADTYEREAMRHTRQRVQQSLSLTTDEAIKVLITDLSLPLGKLHMSRYRYVDINIRAVARILTDNYKLFRWRDRECHHLSMKQRFDMKSILQYVKIELAKFEKTHKEIKTQDLYQKLHKLVFITLSKQEWADKFGYDLNLLTNMLRFLPYTYLSLEVIQDTTSYDKTHFFKTVAAWIDYNKGDLRLLRDFQLILSVQPYVRHVNISSLFKIVNDFVRADFSISDARMYNCTIEAAMMTGMTKQGILNFIAGFTKMESLDVSSNAILTRVPEEILVKLKLINLSFTSITKLPTVLPNTTYLDLSDTNLSTFVTVAPNLTHLNLSFTKVARLGLIPPNLTFLNLSHTPIELLPPGKEMNNLRSLNFEECHSLKELPSSSDAVSLEELALLNNGQIKSIPFYPKLKSLFCEGTQIKKLPDDYKVKEPPDSYKGLRKLMSNFEEVPKGMGNLKVYIACTDGVTLPLDLDSLTVLGVYEYDENPDSWYPKKYQHLIIRAGNSGYNLFHEFDVNGEPINKERVKSQIEEYQSRAAQEAIEVRLYQDSAGKAHATTPVLDNE